MTDPSASRPLPEKVLKRHTEILHALLPEIIRLVLEEGRAADALLAQYLRSHKELGSRDRRFLSQALFSFFRWYGWTVGQLKLEPLEACLLGASLDSTELVESFRYLEDQCNLPFPVKALGKYTLSEKTNLLNERLQAQGATHPLMREHLVPSGFNEMIDPQQVDACIEQYQQRPPAWVRVRSDPATLLKDLDEAKIKTELHPTLTTAFSVSGGSNLQGALSAHQAQYVVQDLASQCVGHVCAPSPGQDWWDCCAGAGGKALHLMDLMQRNGKILATDKRGDALKELKKRARRYGIRGMRTQVHNTLTDEPFKKTFDGILVDAPCSGWGTWARSPDARWRSSVKDIAQYAQRQLRMLNNASWCVRPGGVLVYAVCTLTRPETEEVVMHFLDRNPEFSLQPFRHPLNGETVDGQLQIWPWEGPGDAMFIARLVRAEG